MAMVGTVRWAKRGGSAAAALRAAVLFPSQYIAGAPPEQTFAEEIRQEKGGTGRDQGDPSERQPPLE
jgi:hypothetical protein